MEQILDTLNVQLNTFPVYLAMGVAAIFLIFMITRRWLENIFRFSRYPRLVWAIELVALPLLLLSVLVLLRYFLGNILLDALLSRRTFDNIATALLWLVGAWLLNRGLAVLWWNTGFPQMFESEAPRLLRGIVSFTVYLLALYCIATFVFGWQTSGVLISTGIIAGILGLATQNILSDLFSGLAVTMDQPYSVGDWIELPDGVLGKVVDVTWKSTRIRSFNNSIYVIPNRLASDSVIHNYNLPTKAYSLWFTVSVNADAPPIVVRRLLLDAVLKSSRVLREPPPAIRLFDMTSQPYQYLVWVYFEDYMAQFVGKEQVFMNIWLEFSKAGISPAAVKFDIATRTEQAKAEIHANTIADELRQLELLELLTSDQIDALARVCQKKIFTADDVILEAGETTNSMYIVSAGVVAILRPGPQPAQSTELERLETGAYFGAMSLLTGQPGATTVTAVTLCELIEIPQMGLEPILQANPSLSNYLAQIMAQRQARLASLIQAEEDSTGAFIKRSAAEVMARIGKVFGLKGEIE